MPQEVDEFTPRLVIASDGFIEDLFDQCVDLWNFADVLAFSDFHHSVDNRVDAIGEPALPRHAAARRLDDGSDLALAAAARMSERRDAILIGEASVGARS